MLWMRQNISTEISSTNWNSHALELMDVDDVEGRFFVRVSDTTMDEVEKAFGDVQTIEPDDLPDEFGFITTGDEAG